MKPVSADQKRWDDKYAVPEYIYGRQPVDFLRENIHLLPKGRALDIAAGEGRNAVYLAQAGFEVDAVDISPVGLHKAKALAKKRGVTINAIVADLEDYDLERESYDVVANFYYLQRSLFPKIKGALKPGGMVIFETYTVDQLNIPGAHRPRREFCLKLGELKEAFQDFVILYYSETKDKQKAVARIIARKPVKKKSRVR